MHPLFSDMTFKVSSAGSMPFKKLMIKVRREIVTLGVEELGEKDVSLENHLSPEEWKRAIEEEDVVLFDVRNDYESAVGRFKNAITPPIQNFRDLPEALRKYGHLKEKKVLMYCTGGIRCEKASALFQREGFREVYQLDGGIVTYGERVGDEHWEGDCFVFDERMAVPVGKAECGPSIAVCLHTGKSGAELTNCVDSFCHRLFPVNLKAVEANPEFGYCPDCLAMRAKERV